MSDRTANPYVDQIDTSTPETFRATCAEAADRCRADATRLEEKASDLRGQAQGWIEKGSEAIAEPLLHEASRLEETAQQRLQAAAAYDDNAGNSSVASGAV